MIKNEIKNIKSRVQINIIKEKGSFEGDLRRDTEIPRFKLYDKRQILYWVLTLGFDPLEAKLVENPNEASSYFDRYDRIY